MRHSWQCAGFGQNPAWAKLPNDNQRRPCRRRWPSIVCKRAVLLKPLPHCAVPRSHAFARYVVPALCMSSRVRIVPPVLGESRPPPPAYRTLSTSCSLRASSGARRVADLRSTSILPRLNRLLPICMSLEPTCAVSCANPASPWRVALAAPRLVNRPSTMQAYDSPGARFCASTCRLRRNPKSCITPR